MVTKSRIPTICTLLIPETWRPTGSQSPWVAVSRGRKQGGIRVIAPGLAAVSSLAAKNEARITAEMKASPRGP